MPATAALALWGSLIHAVQEIVALKKSWEAESRNQARMKPKNIYAICAKQGQNRKCWL